MKKRCLKANATGRMELILQRPNFKSIRDLFDTKVTSGMPKYGTWLSSMQRELPAQDTRFFLLSSTTNRITEGAHQRVDYLPNY